MTYALFAIGIGLLVKGADWLIDGASALAHRWGVSSLLIGLTVVAFGTSMPELVVSVVGALDGEHAVVFGNILGSNIINTLFILGIATLIYPPRLNRLTVWREIPFSLFAAVVLLISANNFFTPSSLPRALSRADGVIFVIFFLIFLLHIALSARKERSMHLQNGEDKGALTLKGALGLILVGVLALYIGGIWVVDGAVDIASALGVSSFLISATVVTVGISLPELVTSLRATVRLNTDLAVGNLVGSNIFNIFWILGVTSVLSPVHTPKEANFDMSYLVLVTTLLFLFMFVGEKQKLNRWQGLLLIVLYIVYLGVIIARG